METHYQPPDPTVRRRLSRARRDLATTQMIERDTGTPLLENQPVQEHLRAALDFLFDGLKERDMDCIVLGIVMVQDVELRMRCKDGMGIAREKAIEEIHRIQAWALMMGQCKAPSDLVPAAHGVVEGMRRMLGDPNPDNLARRILQQAEKSEKVTEKLKGWK